MRSPAMEKEAVPSETVPTGAAWWRSPRARWTGVATGISTVLAIGYFLIFLFPFVSTDDARVAATTTRVANLGMSGQIIKLNVEEGMRVTKDEILLELDHREAQARLQRAKARAEHTAREKNRMKELLAERGIAPSQFDRVREEADVAEADFQLAELALEHTFLRSPSDGIVVQKIAEVGNLLESGQTAISVVDVDHAWVSANIEETQVGAVRLGQPVLISVDEGGALRGKITEVRSATAAQFALIPAENPSGNFIKLVQRVPVKIQLEEHPEQALRVGQSVEVKIRVR